MKYMGIVTYHMVILGPYHAYDRSRYVFERRNRTCFIKLNETINMITSNKITNKRSVINMYNELILCMLTLFNVLCIRAENRKRNQQLVILGQPQKPSTSQPSTSQPSTSKPKPRTTAPPKSQKQFHNYNIKAIANTARDLIVVGIGSQNTEYKHTLRYLLFSLRYFISVMLAIEPELDNVNLSSTSTN